MKSKIVFSLFFILLFSVVSLSAQTDSRYNTGFNLPFNEKAGDVNPQTGDLTISATDVSLPGRSGYDFSFGRVWTPSQANVFQMYWNDVTRNNGLSGRTLETANRLGTGWSTNVPYIFADESSGTRTLTLFFGGGAYEVDQTGVSIRNPDKSNLLGYDLIDKRLYTDSALTYGDFTRYPLSSLTGVSDKSTDRSGYVLILSDNSQYWFRPDGRLMMSEDKTGLNEIWYFYNAAGDLVLAVDTVGRKIGFAYDSKGNLAEISWDVTHGSRAADGTVTETTETRRVRYGYRSAETRTEVLKMKTQGLVKDYREPFELITVTDPMGFVTRYDYQAAETGFTYDQSRSHAKNVSLLLTAVTAIDDGTNGFRSKRVLSYDPPAKGPWTRYFYRGYMEYFRLSAQYYLDRRGRKMNETRYIYHENGQAGNVNCYTAVIQTGNMTAEYKYTLSGDLSRNHVLSEMTVTTADGYSQNTRNTFNNDRALTSRVVFTGGTQSYTEKYQYDRKGNPRRVEDRLGLVTVTEYDDKYSIPVRETRTVTVGGTKKNYLTERTITSLGQVKKEILYLEGTGGSIRGITASENFYDAWGNVIRIVDAAGNAQTIGYDTVNHAFPVKISQEVTIASWSGGGDVHANWKTSPDGTKKMTIRNWKVYNSDGSTWIEIDNEGYAIEHYYDLLGTEIMTVNPDNNDLLVIGATDPDDFRFTGDFPQFLSSRADNPKVRIVIDYRNESVKQFADLDRSRGAIKATGVIKDGLGHTEEEIEYADAAGTVVSGSKKMTYDTLGRMVALTDPDAGTSFTTRTVHGTQVKVYDKTWIVQCDDLGRTIRVEYPVTSAGQNSSIKQVTYLDAENAVVTVDPDKRKVYQQNDWAGNPIRIVKYGYPGEKAETHQTYLAQYDEMGRKVKTLDPEGIAVTYRFDERNLLVEQTFANGSDRMVYNDLGQLVKKTDRKGQILVFVYDEMGRNTEVLHYINAAAFTAGTSNRRVRTVYDNRGNAVRIDSPDLVEHYIYDHSNRVTVLDRLLTDSSIRTQVNGIIGGSRDTYGFRYTYNDGGMVTRMEYPDGSIHEYTYDNNLGRLQRIGEGAQGESPADFVFGLEYNRSGVVTRMNYSNGTTQRWGFDNRKRIATIGITGPGGAIESLAYRYDGGGNLLSINDNEYRYDGYGRIEGARTLIPGQIDHYKLVEESFGTYQAGDPVNGAVFNPLADLNGDGRISGADHSIASFEDEGEQYDIESFTYDRNGNRTLLVQNGDEYTYEYDLANHNQLKKVYVKKAGTTTRKLFAEYFYDGNGNTIKRVIQKPESPETVTFTYDTMNRVILTQNGTRTIEYTYDNAGNRLYKKESGGALTVYFRHGQIAVAMDIELTPESTTERGKSNRYILSGDLLAGRVTTIRNLDNTTSVKKSWYHLDHLNSTKCITDEAGIVEVNYTYRAFGEQLRRLAADGTPTDDAAKYSYGGKELDEEIGLYYFNARYYDATLGRFISLDPVQDGSNWYVYCSNNPLCFVDPTGLDFFESTYDPNTETLTAVYTPTDADGNRLDDQAQNYTWTVTNNVRNELNGLRDSPNATTSPADGTESQWYFPRQFPAGNWIISSSVEVENDPENYGEVFIPTNAQQEVPVYGPASQPMPQPGADGVYIPTGTQMDRGYGAHAGTESWTWGCLKFSSQDDANLFASLSDQAITSQNGSSTLNVLERDE